MIAARPTPAQARWRPSALLLASAALHAGALGALLAWPQHWLVLAALLVADHLVVAAIGLWPRSHALGANLTRLPPAARVRREVAITIDDGPDPQVTPGVLALLADANVQATFFCIGAQAERHPQLVQAIVAGGHEIGNHGQRHPLTAALLGLGGWRREVEQGQQTLKRLSGQTPRFYRAVAGLRNPLLDPVLHALGLSLASWTRRGFDTVSADAAVVLRRLTRGLAPGDILLLHDGHAARGANGEAVILRVLPPLLAELRAHDLRPVRLSAACNPPSSTDWSMPPAPPTPVPPVSTTDGHAAS